MDITKIVLLLKNSGLQNIKVGNDFIEFDDPSCIYTAFDNILEFGWIVIVFFTALMLFGWAVLYIKNGIKINSVFNNAKTIILIFCILSAIKPIVNVVYGDNLFARACERKRVSLIEVRNLLELRNKTLSKSDEDSLYEIFDMTDSGVIYEYENNNNSTYQDSITPVTVSVDEEFDNNSNEISIKNSDIVRVIYSKNSVVYVHTNGERTRRTDGTSSWRYHNPGNIRASKYSKNLGAIDTNNGWAVFPSEEAGLNAIVKLLRSKNYRNLSIKDAIYRYCPFGDGNNNPESYARKVSKMTGLPANATINTLSDEDLKKVANTIKTIEGWRAGKEEKI